MSPQRSIRRRSKQSHLVQIPGALTSAVTPLPGGTPETGYSKSAGTARSLSYSLNTYLSSASSSSGSQPALPTIRDMPPALFLPPHQHRERHIDGQSRRGSSMPSPVAQGMRVIDRFDTAVDVARGRQRRSQQFGDRARAILQSDLHRGTSIHHSRYRRRRNIDFSAPE